MTKQEKMIVTVSIEMEIDPIWIEFVTGGSEGMVDVFLRDYCGYWMEGIEHDSKLGWLAYEFGATDRHSNKREKESAIKAWRAGEKLPEHFHALNLDLVKKSWQEGVKKFGVTWHEDGDGNTYDCAVQLALLGSVTYG